MTRLSFVAFSLCLSVLGQLSSDPRAFVLRGRITGGAAADQSYTVQVESIREHSAAASAITDLTGEFQINGISAGEYRITIGDRSGAVVHQGFISAIENGPPVEVVLPARRTAQPSSGVVTLASLTHKVPSKAARRLEQALAARRKGDLEKSVEFLLSAVSIDPAFTEAHNNLAAAYIDLKRYDDAEKELDIAATLDPASALVQLNRAVCLSRLGNVAEAETAARRAVDLDRTSARAHFALGTILFTQRKFTAEAVDHLEAGAQSSNVGHLMAAQILVSASRPVEASRLLRRYLEDRDASNRETVEKWLARLAPAAR